MKTKLTLIAVMAISVAFADTIPFDSTKLHNEIVNTANVVINAVPAVNPTVGYVKMILLAIGSGITGYFIHFFKKRNQKK